MNNKSGHSIETGENRSEVIDILKGIGILFMVLGHMHFSKAFNYYIFGFHMPLFFMVSGYLYRRPASIYMAVIRKAKSLLIPYLSFGVGYWLLWIIRFRREDQSAVQPLWSLLLNGTEGLVIESALWFLPTLFIVYIIFVLIDRIVPKTTYKVYIAGMLALTGCMTARLFFDIGGGYFWVALSASGLFLIGICVKEHIDYLKTKWIAVYKAVPFLGIAIANMLLIYLNGDVNMRTGEWAFLPLTYINAIVGTWVYLCVSVYVCKKMNVVSKILCYIGKNSIVFVCTNHFTIMVGEKIMEIAQNFGFPDHYVLQEILVFIISVIIMTGITEIFSHTKLKVFIGR